jgi:serine O-acetyltransferase
MKVYRYIKSDAYRHLGHAGILAMGKLYLSDAGFNYMVWHRLAQTGNAVFARIARFVLARKMRSCGIVIPASVQIGYGLMIPHHGPCVVNWTAKIGSNCNISSFVNIGSNADRAAFIGDNVYIGPNVSIVEDVKIGSNVTIGAGAVVTRDIDDNLTVAGVPAKPLNANLPGRFISNRWTF